MDLGNVPSRLLCMEMCIQRDASMDVKAATQDLAQLDTSDQTLMKAKPHRFQVKVPAGGFPGRRMQVHLPGGRMEMVSIPPHVEAGQILEVGLSCSLPTCLVLLVLLDCWPSLDGML